MFWCFSREPFFLEVDGLDGLAASGPAPDVPATLAMASAFSTATENV